MMNQKTTAPPAALIQSKKASQSCLSSSGMRRRTLLAGAAWAVPAITLAAPAAYAAASGTPSGKVCALAYYEGTNDYQQLRTTLAGTLSYGVVPAGTVLTWRIVAGDTNTTAPVLSTTGPWDFVIASTESGSSSTTWILTATAQTDIDASSLACDLFVSWRGTSSSADGYLVGGSTLLIQTFGTGTPGTNPYLNQISFTVAERRTDMATGSYTQSELDAAVSAHVWSTRSNVDTWPPVYWDASGIADTSDVANWVNAKTIVANTGASTVYYPSVLGTVDDSTSGTDVAAITYLSA